MIAKAGPIPFSYNNPLGETGKFIRAFINNITDLGTVVPLANVNLTDLGNGQYAGIFTGVADNLYAICMKVYTDGTYTVLDDQESTVDSVVQCVSFASGGGSTELRFETKLIAEQVETQVKGELTETVMHTEIIEEAI